MPTSENPFLKYIEGILADVTATKYLTLAGLVILLYDHLLTFDAEIRLIWPARRSVSKFVFLCNRYFVPVCLSIVNFELSGLSQHGFSDNFCKTFVPFSAIAGVISLSSTNYVVLSRVLSLWENKQSVVNSMTVAYAFTHAATLTCVIISVLQMIPMVSYNHDLHICVLSKVTAVMPAVWAIPLVFEIFVFVFTCWNALDRPRLVASPLVVQVLYRDGLIFFMTLTSLRVVNLVITLVSPVSLVFLALYFIWAMVVLIISRLIINIHEAEAMAVKRQQALDERWSEDFGDTCTDETFELVKPRRMERDSLRQGRVWETTAAQHSFFDPEPPPSPMFRYIVPWNTKT